jgi:peptide/nickel transport system substrate-binding protein
VTEVVVETVIVEGTPQVVEKEVTRVVKEEVEVEKEVTRIVEVDATTEEVDSKYGGTLRYGLYGDPQNWTPLNVISCQNEVVMAQIWSALLRYDGTGELVGDLAESWEWEDDVTVVFHLRENVTWHNGDPFVASDVVKTMELRKDPLYSMDAETMVEYVEGWEALDDHTVKLTLKKPNVSFLRLLSIIPGHGFILHPDWDEATSGQSFEATVGTGPFMYESYDPGIGAKLVRNPNYFIQGLPYLDAIELRVVDDDEARMTGLRAGDLDMIEYVDFQSLPMLKEDSNIFVPEGKGFYGARFTLDATIPPTDDVLVRRAINYAMDREMLVDAVLAGEGEPIWGSMLPPDRFGYAPDLDGYWSYDTDKALELLAEAGWTDTDGDGLLDKDGSPMELGFITYGPSWWSQAAEIFQANMRDIGVTVNLEVYPWADYKLMRDENLNLPEGEPGKTHIFGTTIWGLDISDYWNYVHSTGFYNFARYRNQEVDALLEQALATPDDAEREALFQEAQRKVIEDVPFIASAWISRAEAVRTRVKNFSHNNETACYGSLIWESYLED